jgi:hypothetical protein
MQVWGCAIAHECYHDECHFKTDKAWYISSLLLSDRYRPRGMAYSYYNILCMTD